MKTYWIWKHPRGYFVGDPERLQRRAEPPLCTYADAFLDEDQLVEKLISKGYKLVKVKLVEVKE